MNGQFTNLQSHRAIIKATCANHNYGMVGCDFELTPYSNKNSIAISRPDQYDIYGATRAYFMPMT